MTKALITRRPTCNLPSLLLSRQGRNGEPTDVPADEPADPCQPFLWSNATFTFSGFVPSSAAVVGGPLGAMEVDPDPLSIRRCPRALERLTAGKSAPKSKPLWILATLPRAGGVPPSVAKVRPSRQFLSRENRFLTRLSNHILQRIHPECVGRRLV
jgi:hypothetical protein